MPRVYLPLLPIPVLAMIVAFSACSRTRSEEPVTHLIPPPAPYAAPAASTPAPMANAAPLAVDDAPSEEEVKAFERHVGK
jgi:hypothetical protein